MKEFLRKSFEKYFFFFFFTVVVGWAALFGWFLRNQGNEKERLVKQCMDDGHKEYECHRLLR